ncbi:MAG: glycyl-radical enzyme activating protein [Verrucomicrobiota bacterium JB025]|nr:glycyl-radical enzyme activating protein [Verrucomicrobiota bacterium JB025]
MSASSRVTDEIVAAPCAGDERAADCPQVPGGDSGRIFDIKRFSTHDGPGIRSTVFFTNCPLRCAWCHNPEAFALCGSGHEDEEKKVRMVTIRGLLKEVERDVAYYDRSGGGVTLSGGEPLVQARFVERFLTACRKRDLHAAVDTSGAVPVEFIEMAAELGDLILYDLKSIDDGIHREWTGKGNGLILGNLERLNELDVDVWIRLPMIPGVNDDAETLEKTVRFLRKTRFRRVSVLPYHRIGEGKYAGFGLDYRLVGVDPHPPERITEIRRMFADAGFDSHVGS